MKLIPLSQGLFAQVDDDDFEFLDQWKWSADKSYNTWYARRTEHLGNCKLVRIRMHRLIMQITDRKVFIDHKDGNGLNNQKDNLRICSCSNNGANRRVKAGTSKYLGVNWDKQNNRWKAQIHKNGLNYYLGNFKNETDAAIAYNNAATIHHGEFANLNKI